MHEHRKGRQCRRAGRVRGRAGSERAMDLQSKEYSGVNVVAQHLHKIFDRVHRVFNFIGNVHIDLRYTYHHLSLPFSQA